MVNSAKTSRNQVSAVITKTIDCIPVGSKILDYGGGRFDKGTAYYAERGIESFVYDPYNRTPEHNAKIEYEYDYAVCGNVLNVIKDKETRHDVIHDIMKRVPVAFFCVYEGDRSGIGTLTKDGWQNNQKTSFYQEEILELGYASSISNKIIMVTKY